MRKLTQRLALLLLLGLLSTIIPGCENNLPNEDNDVLLPPNIERTLIVAQRSDAVSLDPHTTNDQSSARVMSQIFETLIIQNKKMEFIPALAEDWQQVDETTYEFKLREGVLFHNGEEMTAEDVRFSFLRGLNYLQVSGILGILDPEKIVVVDRYTIRVGTVEPFAPLLSHLSHIAASILSKEAVGEGDEEFSEKPIGTGPYRVLKWNRGENIHLSRFDEYHGKNAIIKNITIKTVSDDFERTNLLENGSIHIAYDIMATDIGRIMRNEELNLYRLPNNSITYIGFNLEKPPFNDVRIRWAINYAIDMEPIIAAVFSGVGTTATGPLDYSIWGAHQSLKPYNYDIYRGKKLMKAANLEEGFKATIWTNNHQQRIDLANAISNQLKAINIDLTVKIVDGEYLQEATKKGDHDMVILGWITVTGDADYGLYPLFHSSQMGRDNVTFYMNQLVDEKLEKARRELNMSLRRRYYVEIQEQIRNDAPWVFAWFGEDIVATRKNIQGFRQHPAGYNQLSIITFTNN